MVASWLAGRERDYRLDPVAVIAVHAGHDSHAAPPGGGDAQLRKRAREIERLKTEF
jgi:hypothetical protein